MPPLIEEYAFGRVVVEGVEYRADVIILPGRVVGDWWRREGHRLAPEDLEEVIAARAAVLVVGTGAGGVMNVPPATVAGLERLGIKVETAPTARAVAIYNELARRGENVAAALHLTC